MISFHSVKVLVNLGGGEQTKENTKVCAYTQTHTQEACDKKYSNLKLLVAQH
jgi:hypothetical protein